MRHPALLQKPFAPLTTEQAAGFQSIVVAALAEDGSGDDVTTASLIPPGLVAAADIVLRSGGVVAGLPIAALAFKMVDAQIDLDAYVVDGVMVRAGTAAARVQGPARSMLTAERVALNFLGRLSGIATLTRAFVDAVRDLPVRICDTRKTTPGLRALERYAVRAGGGYNHRFGLADAVLIKDNHLAAAESIAQAVAAVRARIASNVVVEVECESLEHVRAALDSRVDAVLLDNMDIEQMHRAVALAQGQAVVEASGGITLENVRDVARTGVDIISVGALTHSARSADVALDFVARPAFVATDL